MFVCERSRWQDEGRNGLVVGFKGCCMTKRAQSDGSTDQITRMGQETKTIDIDI